MNCLLPSQLLVIVLLWVASASGVQDPVAAQDGGLRIPAEGMSIRLQFGLKDKQPSAWDGRIFLSQGKVVAMEVSPPRTGSAADAAWKLRTVPQAKPARKSVHDPKLATLVYPLLVVTVEAPLTATAWLTTPQGEFTFALADQLASGTRSELKGQVQLDAAPMSFRLTDGPDDEDWPAAAQAADGTVWMAYTAYQHCVPLDPSVIHSQRKFDNLIQKGNGDQLRLAHFDGRQWGKPINLSQGGLDVWRPSVAPGTASHPASAPHMRNQLTDLPEPSGTPSWRRTLTTKGQT